MFVLPILIIVATWTHSVTGYQLQGGNRQTLQVTAPAELLQPASIVLQGNSEDGDNLQPAMGYETLSQHVTGIKLQ